MTFTVFIQSFSAVIFLIVAADLFISSLKKKTIEIYYFILYALFNAIFHGILFVGTFFYIGDPVTYGLIYASAHFFVFTGISYMMGFATSLAFAKWSKRVFLFFFIISALGAIIFILNAPTELKALEGGASYLPVISGVGEITLQVVGTLPGIFGMIMFIVALFKANTKVTKLKALMLAIGFLLVSVAGPMHNIAATVQMYHTANILLLVGDIIMLVALYLPRMVHRFKNKTEIIEQPIT